MNKLLTILFSLLTITSGYGQEQQDLSGIINKIQAINELQYENVGIDGAASDNFKNYLELKHKANTEQLIKLTDNPNAVVTCYASWALIDRSFNDLPSILIKFLNKDRDVSTFRGCIKSTNPLSSEFYHRYWNSIDEKLRPTNKTLFTLDSLILYDDKSYWLLTLRALEDRVYPTSFNKRIEYLAFTKANKDAITYLQNLHDKTYDEKIKQALIKYLQQTNFSDVGVSPYFETVSELLKYNDEKLKDLVIVKLKNDTFWTMNEERFLSLLKEYNIQTADIKRL